jgi:hypothetical protein
VSSNNSIFENDIANNANGLFLDHSSYNYICHNNFVNNTKQAYIETTSSGYANFWDNGTEGNYWSDHAGVDLNGDHVGDIPYVIDENNQDHYPLMSSPFENELATSIRAPTSITQLGVPISLNATVTNQGSSNESNVELVLLINSTVADSKTITFLKSYDSYTLSYLWVPTVRGIYNVTAYTYPILGEALIENNQDTEFMTVCPVGVKAGDWIKCTYTISGWPSGTAYPEWLKVEFLSVEGTNATVRVTMHMSDGTEQNATMPVDVVAGGGAFQGLSGFVIPANCTTGDSIYMSGYGNVTIAGETTSSYAGATRTVVYASFSQYGTELTYYWDKLTGVMVEASVVSGGVTGTAKATETNMWQAQLTGFPIDSTLLYALVIAVVAIIAAVLFLVIRRKKKPIEAQTRETDTHSASDLLPEKEGKVETEDETQERIPEKDGYVRDEVQLVDEEKKDGKDNKQP